MPAPLPEHQQASRSVARKVAKLVLGMLMADEEGEVKVIVGWSALEPIKTVTTRDSVVKVGRGRMAALERVE